MGTEDILLHHTKAHLKPPGTGAPFPMHQDYGYFPFKNDSMVAAFVHLDDSDPNNGGLAVYPGSHKHGPLEDKGEQFSIRLSLLIVYLLDAKHLNLLIVVVVPSTTLFIFIIVVTASTAVFAEFVLANAHIKGPPRLIRVFTKLGVKSILLALTLARLENINAAVAT